MLKNILPAAAVAAAAVALAGTAHGDAATSWTRVRVSTATGDFAQTTATAAVTRPHAVAFQVAARPRQWVTAHWSIFCQAGIHARSRTGQWSGVAGTLALAPRHPMTFPMSAPDTCIAAVNGQLSRTHSRLTLTIATR